MMRLPSSAASNNGGTIAGIAKIYSKGSLVLGELFQITPCQLIFYLMLQRAVYKSKAAALETGAAESASMDAINLLHLLTNELEFQAPRLPVVYR